MELGKWYMDGARWRHLAIAEEPGKSDFVVVLSIYYAPGAAGYLTANTFLKDFTTRQRDMVKLRGERELQLMQTAFREIFDKSNRDVAKELNDKLKSS